MFLFGVEKVEQDQPFKRSLVMYVLNLSIGFIDNDHLQQRYDTKFLCRVYDDINSCIKLLEKAHGLQIMLTTWLMFSNAVFGVTLVTSQQAVYPWLVILNSLLPFIWCFIGCFAADLIRKEVDKTENLLIKQLIDFRCDQGRKSALQTFKQLVSTQRLQFTACNLFEMNFSMILGTAVNVITYSIILIQLIISKD